jgi:hypothetical protein
VVDTAVSFLLWGVLPSAASTAQKSPPMSRNLAFIHQRRPQHLVLPKVLDGDDALESGKLALNTIYPSRDSAGSPCSVAQNLLTRILEIYHVRSPIFVDLYQRRREPSPTLPMNRRITRS